MAERGRRTRGSVISRWRGLSPLEPRLYLAAEPVISELMAINSGGLLDVDGDTPDWFELHNAGDAAANLDGWYATDDDTNLTQWRFPAITLQPNERVVVFASNKDRAVAGSEPHTNFALDGDGESLMLVMPDGVTIASRYDFPQQRPGVSYGTGALGTAAELLVAAGSEWRYLDNNSDQGTAWRQPGFDDSAWQQGEAQLGYGDGDEVTVVNGGPAGGRFITTYFRHQFNVDNAGDVTGLTLRLLRDDGAVVYLNGEEIARSNIEDGPVDYQTTAEDAVGGGNERTFFEFDLPATGLVDGENTLAVEIHQIHEDSSDISFDLELEAQVALDVQEVFFPEPTPGEPNSAGVLGFVGDTKFSVDRGFFDAPFELEITANPLGSVIRYTTDGTLPTATHGNVYSGPITIDGTTTLRAAAFKEGFLPSNVDTQTYLFLDDVLQQDGSGLPSHANWGHDGPDWEVDPEIVNDPRYRDTIRDDLMSVPTVSLVMPFADWFAGGGQGIYIQGSSIERGVSFEIIDPTGVIGEVQTNGAVEIQGGSSDDRWKTNKLSLEVKFKEQWGPTKLEHQLFPDAETDRFDRFVLDSVLNFSWHHPWTEQHSQARYVQDQVVADFQNAVGGQAPHGHYVHLYIGGLYWGMYYLHEKPDETFAADYLGGDKDDYDVIKHNANTVVHGSNDNYQDMLTRARRNLASAANYDALADVLDVDNFIDYMLINFFAGNTDWAHHNWYATFNRVDPNGKWRFHSWDAEHVFKGLNDNQTGRDNNGAPTEIHQNLLANAEYRLRFADHVQRHLFNDGAMTAERAAAFYMNRMAQVDRAIVGESARWGDTRVSNPYDRDDWLAVQNELLNDYFPHRTGIVLDQLRDDGLYPSIDAPAFNQLGGQVASGFELAISDGGGGTVYYTLDGSDPREAGGAVAGAAMTWSGAPIMIDANVTVNARVLSGGEWSALTAGEFRIHPPADAQTLTISEINYHPFAPTAAELAAGFTDADAFEFIELLNLGGETIDLGGVAFTDGIEFQFAGSAVESLAPGEHVVIVRDLAAFTARYGDGLNVAGEYGGALSNGGELLVLRDATDAIIHDFEYDDGGAWPGRADGDGSSLEVIDAAGDYDDGDNWRSSSEFGGSPGAAGRGPDNRVLINEVLTHTDPPLVDAIELVNTTSQAIDIGGWYLSDSSADYAKFAIPAGTVLAPGAYIVFDESDFNASGGVDPNDFALDGAHGDDVYLFEAAPGSGSGAGGGDLIGFVDRVEFGAALNGESFGRWPNATGGALTPMSAVTLGAANAGPRVGPLVISEIHYNPADPGTLPFGVDSQDLEFVEVFNPTSAPVDLAGWALAGGVDFAFNATPGATVLPAGGALIVLPFDPSDPLNSDKVSAFETTHNVATANLIVVGGYDGNLSNGGESLRLLRPDEPPPDEPTFTPLVIEDDAAFDDESPWPADTDGLGASLHRVAATAFGAAPDAWSAAAPTPGQVDLAVGDTTPPTVLHVSINRGDLQRSMVTRISVTFSEDVAAALDVADLSIVNLTAGVAIAPADMELAYDPATHTATWSFPGLTGETLADGNFVATLHAAQITDAAGHVLDGNGDGNPGGDHAFGLFRYFGDADGDRDVDFADLFNFRAALQSTDADPHYDADFDSDSDGDVDFADLFQFRGRFQTTLEPPVVEASGQGSPMISQSQLTSSSQPGVFNAVSESTDGEATPSEPADEPHAQARPSAAPQLPRSLFALANVAALRTFESPRFYISLVVNTSPDDDDNEDAAVARLRRSLH